MKEKIQKILRDFDENQIKDINEFLNSAQGAGLKNKIKKADKQRLIKELEGIDTKILEGQLKKLKSQDIIKIINNL